MDDNTILIQLEELADRLGIKIRYEPLPLDVSVHLGGFCRIKGEDFVIINKRATVREKIHVLVNALKQRDLSEIYIVPSLRKLWDYQGEQ